MVLVEEIVAEILVRVEEQKLSLRGVIEDYFTETKFPSIVRSVVFALALSVLRNLELLSHIAKQALGIDVDKLNKYYKYLLLTTLYEVREREIDWGKLHRIISKLCRTLKLNEQQFKYVRELTIEDIVKAEKFYDRYFSWEFA